MDNKYSAKAAFNDSHKTTDQYSVPTSCLGQSEGNTLSVLKVSKANGGLANPKGDGTNLKQFSN